MNFNKCIPIFLMMLFGCMSGQDPVEFRGLKGKSTTTTPNPAPTGNARSIVSSLSVESNRLTINGENLDLIEDLTLFSDENPNSLTANISSPLRSLRIISQSRTQIIATGRIEDVNLYFDGRYNLIRKDYNSPVEDNFPFVVIRKEVGEIEKEKVNTEIELDSSKIKAEADDRNVIVFDDSLGKWTTGPITGQLEYLGAWSPFTGSAYVRKISRSVALEKTGTDNLELEPGQYFIIQNDCYVSDLSTSPIDPAELCPFLDSDNLIEGRPSYRSGDWLVYGESGGVGEWHYIDNRGQVESFNNRIGLIEACPNENCPAVYDYNWKMIAKSNSKLSDISDVPIPNDAHNGYVLKVKSGSLVLSEEDGGLSELSSAEIKDGTLVNADFGSGLEQSKFNNLDGELATYVDSTPTPPQSGGVGTAQITGDLNFGTSTLEGVGMVEAGNKTYALTAIQTGLSSIDSGLSDKLSSVSTAGLDANTKYYLSTNAAGTLEWKELTTENVADGATKFYFSAQRVREETAVETYAEASGEIANDDSLKVIFQKLRKKLRDFLGQTKTEVYMEKSITFEKLKAPTNPATGNVLNGFLYFDSSIAQTNATNGPNEIDKNPWSIIDISGFNLVGDLNPNESEAVANLNNSNIFSGINPGDFYVISHDFAPTSPTTPHGIINLNASSLNGGDWIVWDGSAWRKIDYQGKVVSIFGEESVIKAKKGDYTWEQVVVNPYSILSSASTFTDPKHQEYLNSISKIEHIENVNGTPEDGFVLKWNNNESRWDVVADSFSSSNIGSANISGLTDAKFNASANIAQNKVIGLTDALDGKLKKSLGGSLTGTGDVSFSAGTIININQISNGTNTVTFNEIQTNLNAFQASVAAKQNDIVPGAGSQYIAGNLVYRDRNADAISDSSNKFFSDSKVMTTTLRGEDLDGKFPNPNGGADLVIDENTNILPTTAFGEAFDILVYKVKNRYPSPYEIEGDFIPTGQIEPRHFEIPTTANAGDSLYFNGTDWELRPHTSSIRYIGAVTDTTPAVLKASPDQGDYYIGSGSHTRDFGAGNITFNSGDWIMYINGVWTKISNASSITSFDIGVEDGAGSGVYIAKDGAYTLSQIDMEISSIMNLSDVSGSPAEGYVLKWDVTGWKAKPDEIGVTEVSGSDIKDYNTANPGSEKLLTRANYKVIPEYTAPTSNPSAPDPEDANRLPASKINIPEDDYLKTSPSAGTQTLTGNLDLVDPASNIISGVGTIAGVDFLQLKTDLDAYITGSSNFELNSDVPLDDTTGEATNFLISEGLDADNNDNPIREFRSLTWDDVTLPTDSTLDFYTSEKVFGTPLTGYTKPGTIESVTASDTILSAVGQLEANLAGGGESINTRLYEDGIDETQAAASDYIFKSKYAITPDDNNNVFISSYSIFSLPEDLGSIPNGFNVTIKAENGPVYIYPAYKATRKDNPPKFEGEYSKLILTEAGAFARIEYEGDHWRVTDSDPIKKNSFSVFKDDKPEECPEGMIGIPGSYLLETNGFCVSLDKQGLKKSGTYEEVISDFNESTCYPLAIERGGGSAKVLTYKNLKTIHSFGLQNRSVDGVLYLNSRNYKNQWGGAISIGQCTGSGDSSNWRCGHSRNYGSNQGFLLDDSKTFQHYLESSTGSCGVGEGMSCEWTGQYLNYYHEILDFDFNDVAADQNNCHNSNSFDSSLQQNTNVTINAGVDASDQLDRLNPTEFTTVDKNSLTPTSSNCRVSNFDTFSGAKSTFTPEYPFDNFSSQFNEPSSIATLFKIPEGKFSFQKYTDVVPTNNQIRCMYVPGTFTCDHPAITEGYDTVDCDASSGKITASGCSIVCDGGFDKLTDKLAAHAVCAPDPGENEGTFEFEGCYTSEQLSPETISSCSSDYVTVSGVYIIDLVSHSGEVIEDVKVFCEKSVDGNYIDLVKTLALADEEDNLYKVAGYFLRANNSSTLHYDIKTNIDGRPGLIVYNEGEDISSDEELKSNGFEIGQWGQSIKHIEMSYRMQGSVNNADTCTEATIGVPLSGPGSQGNVAGTSRALSGYSVVQGNYQNNKASSILVQNFSHIPEVDSDPVVYSFSGSGGYNDEVLSCSSNSRIPKIDGFDRPSTFFTNLKFKPKSHNRCSIPDTSHLNATINCGSVNEDGFYAAESCNAKCDAGMIFYPEEIKVSCESDRGVLSFENRCVDPNATFEIIEPFEDADSIDSNFELISYPSLSGRLNLSYLYGGHGYELYDLNGDGNMKLGNLSPDSNQSTRVGHMGLKTKSALKLKGSEISFDYYYVYPSPAVVRFSFYPPRAELNLDQRKSGKDIYPMSGYIDSDRPVTNIGLEHKSSGLWYIVESYDVMPPISSGLRIGARSDFDEVKVTIKFNLDNTYDVKFTSLKTGEEVEYTPFGNYHEDFTLAHMEVNVFRDRLTSSENNTYVDNFHYKGPKYLEMLGGGYKLPDNPSDYEGYNVANCNTAQRKLLTYECEVTCDTGYQEDPLNPIQVMVNEDTKEFVFKGCYASLAGSSDERVERLISDRNILHVKAESASANTIISHTSETNKYGEEFEFSANATSITNYDGRKFFNFNQRSSKLINADFHHLKNKEKYQAYAVIKPIGQSFYTSNYNTPGAGSIYYNLETLGSYGIGNSTQERGSIRSAGVYHTPPTDYYSKIHNLIATFDGTKDSVERIFTYNIDGTELANTLISGQTHRRVTGNSNGINIGGAIYGWNGEIAEIIFFDEILSDEQLEKLDDYFTKKYQPSSVVSTSDFSAADSTDVTSLFDWSSVDTSNADQFDFNLQSSTFAVTSPATVNGPVGFSIEHDQVLDYDPVTNPNLPPGGYKVSIDMDTYTNTLNSAVNLYSGAYLYDPSDPTPIEMSSHGIPDLDPDTSNNIGLSPIGFVVQLDPNDTSKYYMSPVLAGAALPQTFASVHQSASSFFRTRLEITASPLVGGINNVHIRLINKDTGKDIFAIFSSDYLLSKSKLSLFHSTEGESSVVFKGYKIKPAPRCIRPAVATGYDLSGCGNSGDLLSSAQCKVECDGASGYAYSLTDIGGNTLAPYMVCEEDGKEAVFRGCAIP